MKGTILRCLKELVEEKFGVDKWRAVAAKVEGMPRVILPISDVPDAKVIEAVQATCDVLGITLQQAADAFGDYWVNVYSQKYYSSFYKNTDNARDFILSMDKVHEAMTSNLENAHPPKFSYAWKDDKTLILDYASNRGLIDFAVGLLKGVGIHYNTNLKITKLSDKQIEIIFP